MPPSINAYVQKRVWRRTCIWQFDSGTFSSWDILILCGFIDPWATPIEISTLIYVCVKCMAYILVKRWRYGPMTFRCLYITKLNLQEISICSADQKEYCVYTLWTWNVFAFIINPRTETLDPKLTYPVSNDKLFPLFTHFYRFKINWLKKILKKYDESVDIIIQISSKYFLNRCLLRIIKTLLFLMVLAFTLVYPI